MLDVITRVFTDDIDYARTRLFGIVQIRESVAESRTEMQQRRRRFARHAVITIGCTGDHTFKQA